MTPHNNQSELRVAELIQRATIARRVYTAKRPHALDAIKLNTDGVNVELFPYNTMTEAYVKDLANQAYELNFTCRMLQKNEGGKIILGVEFRPRPIPTTANCFPTINRAYFDYVQRTWN